MASPTSKSRPLTPSPSGGANRRTPSINKDPPEVVDPVWLVKAIGLTIVAALVCGYLTLCLLFYQGQWQLVLHPSRTMSIPLIISGVSFEAIHFGVDETATPQLTGWLVPVEPSARYAAYTVLYLPKGDGSVSDSAPTLAALHTMGVNVFAFDYRGYGQSASTRPNQERMMADANAAWLYLTRTRALPASHIVLYGSGVGAALAAQLASVNPEAPAVIFDSPLPKVIQNVLSDPRVKSLPVRMLFHENFAIVPAVATLKTPKLFLLDADIHTPAASVAGIQNLISVAATPKMITTLHSVELNGPLYREQTSRFLDQYLH